VLGIFQFPDHIPLAVAARLGGSVGGVRWRTASLGSTWGVVCRRTASASSLYVQLDATFRRLQLKHGKAPLHYISLLVVLCGQGARDVIPSVSACGMQCNSLPAAHVFSSSEDGLRQWCGAVVFPLSMGLCGHRPICQAYMPKCSPRHLPIAYRSTRLPRHFATSAQPLSWQRYLLASAL
jgi:hypothetical protein